MARGFTQREGVDYDKTFSPVLQPALLRSLMAIAAKENWEIDQVDVKTAFLYGDLDEEIYLKLPDGSIRRLRKAIYGLKQAGRQFNKKFDQTLKDFKMIRCSGDTCCYIREVDGEPLIVLIHVDDALIFGPNRELINEFKDHLRKEYTIADMGPAKYCLGWEIRRMRDKGLLSINQRQYTKEVLKRFGMFDCAPKRTPAVPGTVLTREMQPKTDQEKDNMKSVPYLEALGCLLYLAICTRPDISFAVSELAKFANNPGREHWEALKRVMRYLKGTMEYGLSYGKGHLRLYGYADANYARCPDTRRSRYGGLAMINNGAVDWRSKMQSIVALSSMEAEYIGGCELVRIMMWLKGCLNELKLDKGEAMAVGMDNKSAKMFAEEYMVQNRSKHIDTKYHYIRERVAEGMVKLFYQPTKEMPADLLTKPLGPTLVEKFRKMMGVRRVGRELSL